MIALIQRVIHAEVAVRGKTVARAGYGILALVAIEKQDADTEMHRLAERLLNYRIFPDQDKKMNLSLCDIGGELLLVPQFTLAADTRKGNRPSFSAAAPPEKSRSMFEQFVGLMKCRHQQTECGCFGEDMQVSLTNDGPVTFLLQVASPTRQ
jgi:D-tyrosyl-tRNA(Tyr) deacylase